MTDIVERLRVPCFEHGLTARARHRSGAAGVMYDDAVVYSLDACEFALRPTGILDGRGRMIYAKPVVGFARPLKEYVVKEDETDENRTR